MCIRDSRTLGAGLLVRGTLHDSTHHAQLPGPSALSRACAARGTIKVTGPRGRARARNVLEHDWHCFRLRSVQSRQCARPNISHTWDVGERPNG
eukprot:6000521-Alexandrium_andersonii.AAC.1